MPASVVLIPDPCAVETGFTPGERINREVKFSPFKGSLLDFLCLDHAAQLGRRLLEHHVFRGGIHVDRLLRRAHGQHFVLSEDLANDQGKRRKSNLLESLHHDRHGVLSRRGIHESKISAAVRCCMPGDASGRVGEGHGGTGQDASRRISDRSVYFARRLLGLNGRREPCDSHQPAHHCKYPDAHPLLLKL